MHYTKLIVATAALGLAACGHKESPLSKHTAFVALPVTAAGAHSFAQGKISADGTEFYLAINRDQLGQRFFFTAMVEQWIEYIDVFSSNNPNPSWSIPTPLLSTIVKFEIHDGQLFVIDASKAYALSNGSNPEVVIDTYPIVHDSTFDQMAGNEQYVLINPAAGDRLRYIDENPFGGSINCPNCQDTPRIQMSFAQKFQASVDANGDTDAVMFDQIVAGVVDVMSFDTNLAHQDGEKFSGTLGIAIRRYSEGPGFVPTLLNSNNYPQRQYFFHFSIVPEFDQFVFDYPVLKWNFHPGMTPIEWIISDEIYNEPRSALYDLGGAIKRGIEDWNAVFGYPVFHASVGSITDALRDDTKSVIVWDNDPAVGFAFMNGNPNPDTGEMRRGFVYIPPGFITSGEIVASQSGLHMPVSTSRSPRLLGWAGRKSNIGCVLPVTGAEDDDLLLPGPMATAAPPLPTTKKAFVETYLQGVIRHEVGHNLGLRHNFEGSLSQGHVVNGNYPDSVSTSIMDYLRVRDDVRLTLSGPGTYDAAAVNFLYNGGPEPASFAFCTDEDTFNGSDPNCTRSDDGSDPLHDYWTYFYNLYINVFGCPDFCSPSLASFFDSRFLNGMMQYVRAAPDLGVREDAWNLTFSPARLGDDQLANQLIRRTVLDTPDRRGQWTNDPAPDILAAAIIPDVQATLVNAGGLFSFGTRRSSVDALKQMQIVQALDALITARASIAAARASLTGDAAALTDDLLSRIDAATHPYFK